MEIINYKVSYIRIATENLQRAQNFYEGLLEFPLISQNIVNGYLLFSLSDINLIIEKTEQGNTLKPGKYLGISLKVREILHVYDRLTKRGVKFKHPPEKQFWGGYLTEFQDPDGNIWNLSE